jgi:CDP-glycerol glycerophosphotransferase (TagB/SpsB family)
MSAGRLVNLLSTAIALLVLGLVGWLLIAPLAALFPRRRDLVVVIGMGNGKFIDNAKYFFLQSTALLHPRIRVVFVTERRETIDLLANEKYEVLRYPSWRSVWALLRCSTAVVDSGDWLLRMRRFLLFRAKIVQLWHGVGFKRVCLDKMRHEARRVAWLSSPFVMRLRLLNGAINGKYVRYSLFLSPSKFYEAEVFRKAFPSRHYIVSGYPRNTFGTFDKVTRRVAWLNVDRSLASKIPIWLDNQRRFVLITPTFRDSRVTTLDLEPSTLKLLDNWCERNNVELVFKFHPFERGRVDLQGEHLHYCDPDSDIYPLMPLSSALITDYSSIYMDYLLLDKPVLFFTPDLADFLQQDRELQFDFRKMTPGPKLSNWDEVTAALIEQWKHDAYVAERARWKEIAFDGRDQNEAVSDIVHFMQAQKWIV